METIKNAQTILAVLFEHKVSILTSLICVFNALFTIVVLKDCKEKTKNTCK